MKHALGMMFLALAAAAVCGEALAGRSQRFGDYVVYYNAFDAGSRFTPYVAPGVEQDDDPGAGLVIVAVRRPAEASIDSVRADITGSVSSLLGQRARLAFSKVESDGYVSYVADYDLEQFPVADFEVRILAQDADRPFELEFEARFSEHVD